MPENELTNDTQYEIAKPGLHICEVEQGVWTLRGTSRLEWSCKMQPRVEATYHDIQLYMLATDKAAPLRLFVADSFQIAI